MQKEREDILVTICNYLKGNLWFDYQAENKQICKICKKHKHINAYNIEKNAKTILIKLCNCLEIPHKFIRLKVNFDTQFMPNEIGLFKMNSEIGADICILYSKYFDGYHYAIVLLHELLHYFIRINNFNPIIDEELTVELMMIYLGLGDIMKEVYKFKILPFKRSLSNNSSFKAGYISAEEISFCQSIFSR